MLKKISLEEGNPKVISETNDIVITQIGRGQTGTGDVRMRIAGATVLFTRPGSSWTPEQTTSVNPPLYYGSLPLYALAGEEVEFVSDSSLAAFPVIYYFEIPKDI